AIILTQIWYVVPSLIIPILYPKIAEKKKEKDYDNYFKVITLLYGTLNYLAIGVVLFMYVFGDYIILELYGSDYKDSTFILKILIWNLIILFQSHLTTSVMIIEGRERYLFNTKLASVIINVVLNIIFLAKYGIEFAAYSLLISSFVSWIIMALFDSKMRMLLKLNIKSYMLLFNFKKYMI
ncbi:MAG: polysaccharide biosynthesis C-terminal domain-containing protein, partial [Bacteroidota bacterium]